MGSFCLLMTDMSDSAETLARYSDGGRDERRELLYAIGEGRAESGATELLWTHTQPDVTRVPDWLCLLPDILAVSDRFKVVIEQRRSDLDEIGWIAARIVLSSGSQVQRWIPLFGGDADVLDRDATDWGPSGLPIRWYLATSKTAGRHAFALPGSTSHMIVSTDILTALREQRMTGFTAQPARMTER